MTQAELIALDISPSSGVPIYRQIIEQIRRMVASDQLPPGSQLPSVRQLATQLAVNPMTISKAYSLLEAEGVLARLRGKGMIVSEQQVEQHSESDRIDMLRPALEEIVNQAKQLNIDEQTLLSLLSQQFKS